MLMSRRGSGSAISALKVELLIGAVMAASVGLSTAQAASFGHSRLVSAPGQPLLLEVPVTGLTDAEVRSLHAVPAPAQAWRDASMTPPVALESMRLVLLDGYRPGVKVIQLRSDQPLDGPIVDVLLDISTASGQQRYQVSLLAQADRHAVESPATEAARHPRTIDGRPAALSASGHPAAGNRIRVRKGDTMFAIAQRNAVQGVSVYQLMMALQRANPNAFIEDNVNLVKAGATLVMPDLDVLTALSDREARRLFQQHAAAFARYRQRGGGMSSVPLASAGAAAQEGTVSPEAGSASGLAEAPTQPGDRLRLSGSPGAAAAAGQNGVDANPATEGGQAGRTTGMGTASRTEGPSGTAGTTGGSLLAAAGGVASDAVADKAPHASGADHGGAAADGIAAIGDSGTAAAADGGTAIHPDDQAAMRKGVEESRARILELEDNVRHLNEALQKQGHVAAEAALEGARSVSQAIKEAIGVSEPGAAANAPGEVAGTAGTPVGEGTPATAAAAPEGQSAAQGAPAGAPGSALPSDRVSAAKSVAIPRSGPGQSVPGQLSSSDEEEEVSWLQENMWLAVALGLGLLVLIVAWILRRAGAERRNAFESDSPITDSMVREKLQEIDLDLDHPSPDTAGRRVN